MEKDKKAMEYAGELYAYSGWEFCKNIGIEKFLNEYSTTEEIMEKTGITNKRFLEHLLDFLVGRKVLEYNGGKYKFLKEPRKIDEEKISFLKNSYPNSLNWTNILLSKAKTTLFEGKKHFDAGFDNNEFLKTWDGMMREVPWSFRKIAIQKFMEKISENSEILDLGCGSGVSIEQILLECRKKVSITGMDRSKESIQKAKEKFKALYKEDISPVMKDNLKRLEFLQHDMLKPLPIGKKYDVVFMSLLLNHIPEDKRMHFFEDIKSVLKDNGIVVIYQIIHKSKLERAPMWVIHTVPTHHEFPFKDDYLNTLSSVFSNVTQYLEGTVVIAEK